MEIRKNLAVRKTYKTDKIFKNLEEPKVSKKILKSDDSVEYVWLLKSKDSNSYFTSKDRYVTVSKKREEAKKFLSKENAVDFLYNTLGTDFWYLVKVPKF